VTRSNSGQWQLLLGQQVTQQPLPHSLAASLSNSVVHEAFQEHPGSQQLFLVCSKAKRSK
jgi:hypothetical protein